MQPKIVSFNEEEKEIFLQNNIKKIIYKKDIESYQYFNLDYLFQYQELNQIIIARYEPIFVINFDPKFDSVSKNNWAQLLQEIENYLKPKINENDLNVNAIVNINHNKNNLVNHNLINNSTNLVEENPINNNLVFNNQLNSTDIFDNVDFIKNLLSSLSKKNEKNIFLEKSNNKATISSKESILIECKDQGFFIKNNIFNINSDYITEGN